MIYDVFLYIYIFTIFLHKNYHGNYHSK